ncbi:hydroxymethylbilane synthase [Altererythrobacter arenosus]|uniref:Hydroxymethylbilane synthase n=1 Tax=Altererythrobacter arenosus TaxID=3032592 RepID=A0ABY8FSN5_9SPHN|nr:hydroxymethylbilane synthase [Altererythrobacter sp. CAU 1644]WFL76441.1 hydroxymethylbilane synthase [Altererythrobacter sp. CAU 1644]
MPDPVSPEPYLRLGTRRSPLAMAQAYEARARLCAAHGWDEDRVELVPVLASGDKIRDRPLAEIGGKALWTKELDEWLAEGRIDGAVHSMKDVETLRPDELSIAAILPRADVADVLVGAASIREIPPGSRIGTSAPRRAAQLLNARPDCEVVNFRGNVATRISKLAAGEADVTLLAAAGLLRLGESGVGTRLDPGDWLPAPQQGAIGIECRTDDERARGLIGAIDDRPSHCAVLAERRLLASLGGDCRSPVAMLSTLEDETLTLRCALYSPDGSQRIERAGAGAADAIDWVMKLGEDLLGELTEGMKPVFGLTKA